MTKTVTIQRSAGNTYIGNSPEYQVDSVINELLNTLASKPFIFERIQRIPPASAIVKIQHNQIQSKKHIIKEYMAHSAAIEAAYVDIDSTVAFGKQIILQNLNSLYCSALDELQIEYLLAPMIMDEIRTNAEFILDFIITRLRNAAFESKNAPAYAEQIAQGVNVVVAHAFIECIIFENPGNDT